MSTPHTQILVSECHSPLKEPAVHGEMDKFQGWGLGKIKVTLEQFITEGEDVI